MPESFTRFLKRVPALQRCLTCSDSEGTFSHSLGTKGIYHFHENISEQSFKMFSVTEVMHLHFSVLMISTKKVSYFKRKSAG